MADLFQFPWGDLTGLKNVQGHAISDDGDSALFYFSWTGGPGGSQGRFTFIGYDFEEDAWQEIWPFPGLNDPPYLVASDDLSTVAFANREPLAGDDLNSGTDVYILDVATGDVSLVFNSDKPSGGTTLGDYSGDGNTIALMWDRTSDSYGDAKILDLETSETIDVLPILERAGYETDASRLIREIELSDDGNVVAIELAQSGNGLAVYNRAEDTVLDIRDVAGFDELGTVQPVNIELSGDGRFLFFDFAGNPFSDSANPIGLLRIDLDTQDIDYVFEADNVSTFDRYTVSDDGRFVAFLTRVPDIVPSDSTSDGSSRDNDLFVRDMEQSVTYILAEDTVPAERQLFNAAVPFISGDGTRILLNGNTSIGQEGDFGFEWSDASAIDGRGLWLPAIQGDDGGNLLSGIAGAGGEYLRGFGGDDTFVGLDGDDDFIGDAGTDKAILEGGFGRYILTLDGGRSTITVADKQPNGTGTDTLDSVELIEFGDGFSFSGDGVFDLRELSGAVGLSQDMLLTFVEMYVAYFDRAPDALGLFYWGTRLAEGMGLGEIAQSFFFQEETFSLYPELRGNLSDLDAGFFDRLVTDTYDKLLERAPDEAGRLFWIGELEAGRVQLGEFVLAVINGAKNFSDPNASPAQIAQAQADAQTVADKGQIGYAFAVENGMNDVENARDVMGTYDVLARASSIEAAETLIAEYRAVAEGADSSEVIVEISGLGEDPFAFG